MDREKLIEKIKACEPLYVINHPNYCNSSFKEAVWRRIGKEMNQPACVCRKTWGILRNSFRRNIKNRYEKKNGQATSKRRKWQFEDKMSFLLPFIPRRDTCSNLKDVSDDSSKYDSNKDEYDDKYNDIEDKSNDDRDDQNSENNQNEDDDKMNNDDINEKVYVEHEKKRQKEINRKVINKIRKKEKRDQTQPETASAIVMKYLLNEKIAKAQITPPIQINATDMFFSSITATVNQFSPYYQNIAKLQIFSIISELEMKLIMEEQSNTFTQPQYSAQVQSYTEHTKNKNKTEK